MTNQLLVAAALLLLAMTASAKVEVFGCSGAVQSDYCAPTPTGTQNVPGFDVTQDDKKISVPSTADSTKQPKPTTQPSTTTPQSPPKQYSYNGSYPSVAAACNAFIADQFKDSPGVQIISKSITSAPDSNATSWASGQEASACAYSVTRHFDSTGTTNTVTGNYPIYFANSSTPSCPTGYSVSGSTCIKSSDAAIPDKKQDWSGTISGGNPTYTPADDADNSSPTKLPVNQPAPNQVQIGTKGTNGQPQQVTGTINTGGSTIQVQSQETDGNGNSVVKTTTYTFDGAGNHIGTSVGTASGSLTGGGANGSYTPTSGSGTTFPNDYAKSGEAAAAANTLAPKLDQLHTDLTAKTGEADGTATIPTFTDGFGNAFTSLSAWTVPAHSSACPIGTFNIFESTVVMDSHCTLFEQVRQTLSLSAVAFWLVFALFIVLGA